MLTAIDETSSGSGRETPKPHSPTHTVLVVEDDENTRNYIAQALRADDSPYVVTTAGSLEAGLGALRGELPDVILVDLGLPDGNGVELIRCARQISTDIHVLVITVFGDEATVIGAIEAGARGYLLKSEAPEDLRLSVDQVLEGGAPISPGIASHVLRRFTELHPQPEPGKGGPPLTRRERDVLKLIVKGLPYQEAADVLGISRNTVASHIKSIYRKLEVSSRGEAVFEALSRGIVKMDSSD